MTRGEPGGLKEERRSSSQRDGRGSRERRGEEKRGKAKRGEEIAGMGLVRVEKRWGPCYAWGGGLLSWHWGREEGSLTSPLAPHSHLFSVSLPGSSGG